MTRQYQPLRNKGWLLRSGRIDGSRTSCVHNPPRGTIASVLQEKTLDLRISNFPVTVWHVVPLKVGEFQETRGRTRDEAVSNFMNQVKK